jgi:hypothetical protein
MATLPLPQNRLPICPPSVATRCLLICTCVALSVMYIERSMGGRKNLTVLPPAHYAALGMPLYVTVTRLELTSPR